jgi:peptidyl-tRNA hydrolase
VRCFQIVAYQFVISYHGYQSYCSSTVCVMDFSIKSVNSIEKEFNETFEIIRLGLKEAKVNNVNNADDLSPQILMKLNKEQLTKIVNSLEKVMKKAWNLVNQLQARSMT